MKSLMFAMRFSLSKKWFPVYDLIDKGIREKCALRPREERNPAIFTSSLFFQFREQV